MTRTEILASLSKTPDLDVLIVGAGVNGIGVFRDLALNGVRALLVDRADFCSGASAASSHMLHGGLRYLENGEFRLVREALRERNRLLRNAPHYAKPLPTTIPVFSALSGLWNAPLKFLNLLDRPAERGAAVIKIGLTLYDSYVRGESPMPGHYFLSRQKSIEQYPLINPKIIGTANYYDGQMISMERLCVELILDAEAEGEHARALNYVSLVGARGDAVTLKDEDTGHTFSVRPRVVINAAGPWIDLANRALGRETRHISGTKGSHLVIDHPALRKQIGDHGFFFENTDGRIVEINPFRDKVLVGATDIPIDDPDQAVCSPDEEQYILSLVGKVFPSIAIAPSQVVFRYCGVRPLPAANAHTTGQISRNHSIRAIEPDGDLAFPILSLVGGKWTTYRAFAEQAADEVLARLGRTRHNDTRNLPIGGGHDYPMTESEQARWLSETGHDTGLAGDRLRALFERYGTQARVVAASIARDRGGETFLESRQRYSQQEIAYLVEAEKTLHLDDLLLRRADIGLMGETTMPLVKALARVAGGVLGWTKERTASEIGRVVAVFRDRHSVTL